MGFLTRGRNQIGFFPAFRNFFGPWITIGIIVYIALVIFGMPDFCHMVNVGDDKKDLEEPLSPKEPQKEAIPRGANY